MIVRSIRLAWLLWQFRFYSRAAADFRGEGLHGLWDAAEQRVYDLRERINSLSEDLA